MKKKKKKKVYRYPSVKSPYREMGQSCKNFIDTTGRGKMTSKIKTKKDGLPQS